MENKSLLEKQIILESRLSRVEASTVHIFEDIKDIKRNLRWITGLIFSLNSAILGILIKGFGILGQ